MEGRRVNRSAPRRNPLYTMFLCLVAAVFILLVVAAVLGVRLGAAQRAVKSAEAQIEELQKQLEDAQSGQTPDDAEPPAPDDGKLDGEDTPASDPNDSSNTSGTKIGWLDLTGHSEVTVLPEQVFNDYATYYASAGVNLRSGPGTSYSKIQLVDRGAKVKAAAKSSGWTFVSVGSKFGWIKSDYLATTPPAEATAGSLKKN